MKKYVVVAVIVGLFLLVLWAIGILLPIMIFFGKIVLYLGGVGIIVLGCVLSFLLGTFIGSVMTDWGFKSNFWKTILGLMISFVFGFLIYILAGLVPAFVPILPILVFFMAVIFFIGYCDLSRWGFF